MKQLLFLAIIALLFSSAAAAKDITFSLNQTDYYFLTGEPANIPLTIDNTYDEPITGTFTYTITQETAQGGSYYSSSNTNSQTISNNKGKKETTLSFGTSDTPSTMKVVMSFEYDYNGPRIVKLKELTINFVADESQKKNKQNKQSSKSEKKKSEQSQTPQQSQQDALQNSQMAQDSSALKQEIEKQLEEQKKAQQEFEKELSKNSEFQNANQEILQEGYEMTAASVNAESNDTGTFDMTYENEKGQYATLKGEMENGTITQLEKQDQGQLMDTLSTDERFMKYESQLEKDGFSRQNTAFQQEKNMTTITTKYTNSENQTAAIKAELANNTVQKVQLERQRNGKKHLWLLLIPAAIAAAYFLRRKKNPAEKEEITEKPFDYLAESRRMVDEAKKLFDAGEYKDAYGKAAQALRLYLSYENGLAEEMTSYEIIKHIKKGRKEIKECFDLCSLVEFAKYEANRKDFDRITSIAERIIKE